MDDGLVLELDVDRVWVDGRLDAGVLGLGRVLEGVLDDGLD